MNQKSTIWAAAMPTLVLICVVGVAIAGTVTIPNSFTPGAVADANQVNQNFAACKTAIDDNAAGVDANAAAIAASTTAIEANTTAIEKNAGDIAGLSGMAAAGARVQVQWVLPRPPTFPGFYRATLLASFNTLSTSTPTVTRASTGVYEVSFGASVSGRYFLATAGASTGYDTSSSIQPQPTFDNTMILAYRDGAKPNTVIVTCQDETGQPAECSFFLLVY